MENDIKMLQIELKECNDNRVKDKENYIELIEKIKLYNDLKTSE